MVSPPLSDNDSEIARDESLALGVYPVRCLCDHTYSIRMSFNNENPGRRFIKCRLAPGSPEGGRLFHEWVDPEFTANSLECINNLMAVKCQFLDICSELNKALQAREIEIEELREELVAMKEKLLLATTHQVQVPEASTLKATVDEVIDEWK